MLIIMKTWGRGIFSNHPKPHCVFHGTRKEANSEVARLNAKAASYHYSVESIKEVSAEGTVCVLVPVECVETVYSAHELALRSDKIDMQRVLGRAVLPYVDSFKRLVRPPKA